MIGTIKEIIEHLKEYEGHEEKFSVSIHSVDDVDKVILDYNGNPNDFAYEEKIQILMNAEEDYEEHECTWQTLSWAYETYVENKQ